MQPARSWTQAHERPSLKLTVSDNITCANTDKQYSYGIDDVISLVPSLPQGWKPSPHAAGLRHQQ
jgi:hypothetical protein